MTFKELLQINYYKYNKYPVIKGLADVLTDGHTTKMNRSDFERYISNNDQFFYKKNDQEIDDLVSTVNKMVKDEKCPHNIRQNFYTWKHRYIKKLIECRRIERVVESEKLYHFFVRDGHDYHQLKNTFPNGVPNLSEETEIYNHDEIPIESFDKRVYKDCITQLMLYINFDK